MKNSVQFITDNAGVRTGVIMSVAEYERLLSLADPDDDFESIQYEAGEHDNETIPHEVVSIMIDDDVSLLAAWRIYRRMTQQEVAERLGLNSQPYLSLREQELRENQHWKNWLRFTTADQISWLINPEFGFRSDCIFLSACRCR